MEYKFQKLTPTSDVDLSVYENALQYVFGEQDIRNVAIAGAYSSGKSSVIAAFEERHKSEIFLHISLAHFAQENTEEDVPCEKKPLEEGDQEKQGENVVESETVIEGKILNQLIQQIDTSKIPQTEFHLKRGIDRTTTLMRTISVMAFILSFLHMQKFQALREWVDSISDMHWRAVFEPLTSLGSLAISIGVSLILLSLAVYHLIDTQRIKRIFRRLTFQGGEIELFSDTEDSYFDKYLNEVLYLFDNAGADNIVFEDIDRFNSVVIFERLREINTLVNYRRSREGKGRKVIRFFYLLRDDIFVNKDRTKFFDFILPVIPVMDGSNSYNKLKEYLSMAGIFEAFEDHFLRGLSLYIDDLRILKNIFNEFLVYYGHLNKIQLDPNKLLAIITYKNVFPRDFADLQLQRGFVHALFSQKQPFIEEKISKIEAEISAIETRIQQADNEYVRSLGELNDVTQAIRSGYPPFNNWLSPCTGYDRESQWLKNEYPKRKQYIEDKSEERRTELTQKREELRTTLRKLNSQKLMEAITRDNIDEIFAVHSENALGISEEYHDVKGSEYFDLLKFLIRNGYIDETYSDYMTFFYENSLSLNDKLFLQSVTNQRKKEPDYHLNAPSLVLQSLSLFDLSQEECLNHDLIDYIMESGEKEKIDTIIAQVKKAKNYEYISLFLDRGRNLHKFIMYLNMGWPDLFSILSAERKLSDYHIKIYSVMTLLHSNEETIQAVNRNNCLRDYISSQKDYLQMDLSESEIALLVQRMKQIGVLFLEIDETVSNQNVFDAVYKANLYEINVSNLVLFFRLKYAPADANAQLPQFFTRVLQDSDSPFCRYIESNLELTMGVFLALHDALLADESNCIITLLNHDGLSEESKKSYVDRLAAASKVILLSAVSSQSLRKHLLQNSNVSYSVENILYYFSDIGLTGELIAFLESDFSSLDYASYHDDDTKARFLQSVISCNDLLDDKYSQIVRNLGNPMETFSVPSLKREKLDILIKHGLISYNAGNLKFIRSQYSAYIKDYILHDYESYLELLPNSMFLMSEALAVLDWPEVKDNQKIALISCSTEEISVADHKYSDRLIVYILDNNFFLGDLPMFLQNYMEYSHAIQEKILSLTKENMIIVIKNASTIASEALFRLMRMDDISIADRLDLLYNTFMPFSPEKLGQILSALGADSIYNNLNSGHMHVRQTPENFKILEALQGAKIIGNFENLPDGRYGKIAFTPEYQEKYGLEDKKAGRKNSRS